MGSNLSADEVREGYVEAMGEDLGLLFSSLQAECTFLNSIWSQLEELFGTSEERLEVLDFAAPYFFRLVQDVFLEATIIRICRMTDPAKMGKKEKVSLARLPGLIDASIRGKVETLLAQIKADSEFARDWRNRHIAHHDFDLTFRHAATPLASLTKQMVGRVIVGIGELLNLVLNHYSGSMIAFERLIAHGQADQLLELLNDSFFKEQELQERLRSGRLTEDDLYMQPRKPIEERILPASSQYDRHFNALYSPHEPHPRRHLRKANPARA